MSIGDSLPVNTFLTDNDIDQAPWHDNNFPHRFSFDMALHAFAGLRQLLNRLLVRIRGHLQSAVSYAGESSLRAARAKIVPDPLKYLIPLSEASRRESYER